MVKQSMGVGRRKTSVARVYLRPGKGKWMINGRSVDDYFPRKIHAQSCLRPLEVVKGEDAYDVVVNVRGGGITGQAEAIQLGVARALVKADEEQRGVLKTAGMLTRDPRMVERKKYGQPKARKRFQFSKR